MEILTTQLFAAVKIPRYFRSVLLLHGEWLSHVAVRLVFSKHHRLWVSDGPLPLRQTRGALFLSTPGNCRDSDDLEVRA